MRQPPARATIGLVVATSLAWAVVASSGLTDRAAVLGGFIPARFGPAPVLAGAVPAVLTPLTATLLHAGVLHLVFNMLMLGFCGRFVEAALGPGGTLIIYGIGAYAAAAGQYVADPTSFSPMIGASGAASAVLGAYALLYGRQVTTAKGPLSAQIVSVLWLAAAWIGLQVLVSYAASGENMAIATAAHVGGFLCGLVLARPLLLWRYRHA
ncbi:MAG: rhomboid family intramembrane serine protease [Sphingomonadaceae bacterium]|nr:rhomboid family intramembrane serine protease [Sphingomonadaceae bacterium]